MQGAAVCTLPRGYHKADSRMHSEFPRRTHVHPDFLPNGTGPTVCPPRETLLADLAAIGIDVADDAAPDDERAGVDIHVPRKGHATISFSNGCLSIFPDEAWPRVIAAICEERGLPPPQHKPPICQSDDSP